MSLVRYTTPACLICGKSSTMLLDPDRLKKWQSGVHIQFAFPQMSASKREKVITGTHSECWDKAMADED